MPTWGSAQSRTLLKCLLAAPDYYRSREQIIDLLWPGQDPDKGDDALRHALSCLRRALEPTTRPYARSHFVGSDRESIWLEHDAGDDDERGAGLWIDRERFERHAACALAEREALRLTAGAHRAGERALALYRGPFLADDLCAPWTQPMRTQCQRVWAALLVRLSDYAVRARQYDSAAALLGQMVETIPDDEEAVARLMLIHAVTGRRGEALRAFQELRTYFSDVLHMELTAELEQLALAIRSRDTLDDLLARLVEGGASLVGMVRHHLSWDQ